MALHTGGRLGALLTLLLNGVKVGGFNLTTVFRVSGFGAGRGGAGHLVLRCSDLLLGCRLQSELSSGDARPAVR